MHCNAEEETSSEGIVLYLTLKPLEGVKSFSPDERNWRICNSRCGIQEQTVLKCSLRGLFWALGEAVE